MDRQSKFLQNPPVDMQIEPGLAMSSLRITTEK
jgi:hypothetical protein